MKITAALCWWDEPVELLDECVRGAATVADRIVAVDGAFSRYPGATPRSDARQAEAIEHAAADVGLECQIIAPDELWAGQVAKRSAMLEAAIAGSDWVAVLDADWIISGHRDAVRDELAATSEHVVSVLLHTPPSEFEPATAWHRAIAGTSEWQPHFYRALPGLRVESHHFWYSALVNGRRRWVRHSSSRASDWHNLEAAYVVEHRTLQRSLEQIRASRAYCADREIVIAATGQEDDRPELPRPAFDFETIPQLYQKPFASGGPA